VIAEENHGCKSADKTAKAGARRQFQRWDDVLRRLIRLLALVLLAVLTASPASAGQGQVFDLGEKAPVPGNKTWRELLVPLFPDLRQEPQKDGRTGDFIYGKVDLRPIDKDAFRDDCEGPSRIEYLDYADISIPDQARLIVGVTTEDPCFGALALFDAKGDNKLLDAVDIQQDMTYVFGRGFVRSLGVDAHLVVADSLHTNTSVSADNNVLVLATADKLSFIGNVKAESQGDCDHHREISEDGYVTIVPDYGPFDRITGYVKRSVQRVGDDCRTPIGSPVVTITRTDWRWDAAKKAYRKGSP
jgi:hypothetical protein